LLIAHTSHWLVSLAYIAPVVAFLGWLGMATYKERRKAAPRDEGPPSVS